MGSEYKEMSATEIARLHSLADALVAAPRLADALAAHLLGIRSNVGVLSWPEPEPSSTVLRGVVEVTRAIFAREAGRFGDTRLSNLPILESICLELAKGGRSHRIAGHALRGAIAELVGNRGLSTHEGRSREMREKRVSDMTEEELKRYREETTWVLNHATASVALTRATAGLGIQELWHLEALAKKLAAKKDPLQVFIPRRREETTRPGYKPHG